MKDEKVIIAILLATLLKLSQTEDGTGSRSDKCPVLLTCSSCLAEKYCSWCVSKSKCSKQSCGNDNAIYPEHVMALMAGSQFCPKIVESDKEVMLKSGSKEAINVKITQIHVYMAFTQWKCKYVFNGEEIVVNALLIVDNVICDHVVLKNESNKPYLSGTLSVMWDHAKLFDGVQKFKVCNCDLDPYCEACVK